jgi:hypothetical protein
VHGRVPGVGLHPTCTWGMAPAPLTLTWQQRGCTLQSEVGDEGVAGSDTQLVGCTGSGRLLARGGRQSSGCGLSWYPALACHSCPAWVVTVYVQYG